MALTLLSPFALLRCVKHMRYSCSLGRYFGNWLSDRRPLAHSICSPQARLLAAPNRSFLTCHTGAILLLSPLLLITILPNDRHFLWGSKMAPSVLNLSKLWPKPTLNSGPRRCLLSPPGSDFSYSLENTLSSYPQHDSNVYPSSQGATILQNTSTETFNPNQVGHLQISVLP